MPATAAAFGGLQRKKGKKSPHRQGQGRGIAPGTRAPQKLQARAP
jgi:hypothetical protein